MRCYMYLYQGSLAALAMLKNHILFQTKNADDAAGKRAFDADKPRLQCYGQDDFKNIFDQGFGDNREYLQGVMDGRALSSYLLTSEHFPFKRQDEDYEIYESNLYSAGFAFIKKDKDKKEVLCSLSLTCRKDDPTKWVLTLSVGATQAFKDQQVYILSSVKWPPFYKRLIQKFEFGTVFKSYRKEKLKHRFRETIGDASLQLLFDELSKNIDAKVSPAATFELFQYFYGRNIEVEQSRLKNSLPRTVDFSNPILKVLSALNLHEDYKQNDYFNSRSDFYKNVAYFEKHFTKKLTGTVYEEKMAEVFCFKAYMHLVKNGISKAHAIEAVNRLFKTGIAANLKPETIEAIDLKSLNQFLDVVTFFSEWTDTDNRGAFNNIACTVFNNAKKAGIFEGLTSQLTKCQTYSKQALWCQLVLLFPEEREALIKSKQSWFRSFEANAITAFFNTRRLDSFCENKTYQQVVAFFENIKATDKKMNATSRASWVKLITLFASEGLYDAQNPSTCYETCFKLSAEQKDWSVVNFKQLMVLKQKVSVETNADVKALLEKFYKKCVPCFYNAYINSAKTPHTKLVLFHEIMGQVTPESPDAIQKIHAAVMTAKFNDDFKPEWAEYRERIIKLQKDNIRMNLMDMQSSKCELLHVIKKFNEDDKFFEVINSIECQLGSISLKTALEKSALRECRKALYEVIDNQLQNKYANPEAFKAALLAAQKPFDKIVNSSYFPMLKHLFVIIANAVILFFTFGQKHIAHYQKTGDFMFFTRNKASAQMRDTVRAIPNVIISDNLSPA